MICGSDNRQSKQTKHRHVPAALAQRTLLASTPTHTHNHPPTTTHTQTNTKSSTTSSPLSPPSSAPECWVAAPSAHHRLHALLEQVHAQLLEAGTRDGGIEVVAWRGRKRGSLRECAGQRVGGPEGGGRRGATPLFLRSSCRLRTTRGGSRSGYAGPAADPPTHPPTHPPSNRWSSSTGALTPVDSAHLARSQTVRRRRRARADPDRSSPVLRLNSCQTADKQLVEGGNAGRRNKGATQSSTEGRAALRRERREAWAGLPPLHGLPSHNRHISARQPQERRHLLPGACPLPRH
jgi:hypothetical protein